MWTQSLWYLAIAVSLLGSLGAGIWFFLRQRGGSRRASVDQENILIAALMDVEEAAVLTNKHGFIILLNPAAEKLLRQRARSARGKYHTEVFQLKDPAKHTPITWMERQQMTREPLFRECLFNCKGLQDVEITYLVKPLSLNGEEDDHVLLLFKDQSELKALQAHLNYVQMNDLQTKLLNRKSFAR
jgi:PAS domain-containing protein